MTSKWKITTYVVVNDEDWKHEYDYIEDYLNEVRFIAEDTHGFDINVGADNYEKVDEWEDQDV